MTGASYAVLMTEILEMPGHLIRRMQQISSSVFATRMKCAGIDLTSPQFAALAALAKYPDIDQATLAGLIAHDRPTIGGVVARLCKKGFVGRTTNRDDRRAKSLRLTAEGQAILEKLMPVVIDLQNEILAGLNEQEKREFIRLSIKIAHVGNDLTRAPYQPIEPEKVQKQPAGNPLEA